MKILTTNLLRRGFYCDVSKATASHKDYCKYHYYSLRDEFTFKKYFEVLNEFITRFVYLLLAPFFRLSSGLILYPVWIVFHIYETKKTIKKYGSVEELNTQAEEVLERIKDDRVYEKEIF